MAKRLINIIKDKKVYLSLLSINIDYDDVWYIEIYYLLQALKEKSALSKEELLDFITTASKNFKAVESEDDCLYTLPYMIDLDEEMLTKSSLHLEEIREEDHIEDLFNVEVNNIDILTKRVVTFDEFNELTTLLDHIFDDLLADKVLINNRYILTLFVA